MSANIFCTKCGARPFPELGPPGTHQDFDLLKIGGEWRCSQHRDVAAAPRAESAASKAGKWGELESLLDELGRFVANMRDNENDPEEALELIGRAGAAVGRLKSS
jgi:hypothetical protein